MWRLAREATRASSGSTPAGSEKGDAHAMGEDEAGARAAVKRPLMRAAVAAVEEALLGAADQRMRAV